MWIFANFKMSGPTLIFRGCGCSLLPWILFAKCLNNWAHIQKMWVRAPPVDIYKTLTKTEKSMRRQAAEKGE